MKFLTFMALCIALVAGCSSSNNWDVKTEVPSLIKSGQSIPIKVIVKEHDQPVQGLDVKVFLEMKRMDHGNEQITLKDQGNGEYVGNATLPMGGDWVANIELKSDGTKKEIVYEFKTE
ncbi:MAG TPA: FixH family protein [Bacillota bacterium]|nr:FixH family protein [Bacillota bacterium]